MGFLLHNVKRELFRFFVFFCGSATPCASPPPLPSIFSNYSFQVQYLVNQDDRQFLALAMASDFSVGWQCLSKKQF
jgi:hypothetical protein